MRKNITCILVTMALVLNCLVMAYADEIWGRSDKDTIKGTYCTATLSASTKLTVHIPWNVFNQYVVSNGSSVAKTSSVKSGYTATGYTGCHTITAKVSGALPNVSVSTGTSSTITVSSGGGSSTKVLTANTLSVSGYTITAKAKSLVGYRETHSCGVVVKDKKGNEADTLFLEAVLTLY